MNTNFKLLSMFLLLTVACGDSTVVVEMPTEPPTMETEIDTDPEVENDPEVETEPEPEPTPETEPTPMPEPTPETEPTPMPEPTTNAPQSGPTVETAMRNQCSTGAVRGLSLQLLDQMNCEVPGVMKSFGGTDSIKYSGTVFPFQQGPATDTLLRVVAGGGTMNVNSALRTLPQQYLLYEWYQRSLCNANLAAAPGRSNHNGGLAVDIASSDTWRTKMRNNSYTDNVGGEPWHFYYQGAGGRDVRNLSVLAFQKVWNRNFPQDKISEDGLYGPQTEGVLKRSPAEGFSRAPVCNQMMALSAYPGTVPVEVAVEDVGDALDARVIVPGGITYVEFLVNGEIIATAKRTHNTFHAILPSTEDVEIIVYDSEGAVRGQSTLYQRSGLRAIPQGHDNYVIQGMMAWDVRAPYVSVIPGTLDLNVHSANMQSIFDAIR